MISHLRYGAGYPAPSHEATVFTTDTLRSLEHEQGDSPSLMRARPLALLGRVGLEDLVGRPWR
jgi:hypothetical protein